MRKNKNTLIMSAMKLYLMGIVLEGTRAKLRRLVKKGTPYDSPKVHAAYNKFIALYTQWKALEAKHIQLSEYIKKEL